MFEGLVRQLLLGYLGQYIKDIQKEQLKITLWNEEVLLENVELILEAFDYLQLPFALKQGRVGRLSIKIPWKKLGWDPIIIILEDVLICASQRDDQDWSMDAVEKREFAGKKAKLAAAELAKLSKRVCDNQAGNSFVSYITAKILDGIQVSIRNVHVLYRDMLSDLAQTVFGLKFSSLKVMKQNLVGISVEKARVGQVNKLVEVQGFEIYSRTFKGTFDLKSIENASEGDNVYMLAPLNLSVSLLVNRLGKLENDAPQYSVTFELSGLVMSIDEVQLQQILVLCDYVCTCRLREKYGRYRPWWSPLSKKLEGWQAAWWKYAQHCILADVRKRLRKTSWKYLGERLHCRQKYVNLYKIKLECLRQEQLIDDDILQELEQMEKESDIDDILIYRSAAECELQELLEKSSSRINEANIGGGKSLDNERSSSKPREWLNWLSHGMLGAGGTDDSSQFSGVVSDDVITDIYEATKFHPVPLPNVDVVTNDEIYLSSFKFNIHQISATLRSMKFGRAIAELTFEGIFVECQIWEGSAVITGSVKSAEMLNPLNKKLVLLLRNPMLEVNVVGIKQPSLNIEVDVSPLDREIDLSVKVILQALEVTCDSELILNIMEFHNVLESFKFHHERVLLSLNGIDDVRARLLSKAEYILSRRKRVMWDVSVTNIIVIIPCENAHSELHKMVLESEAFSITSKYEIGSFASDIGDQSYVLKNFDSPLSIGEKSMEFQLQDLFNYFEIDLHDFEMKIMMPTDPQTIPVLEKFSSSIKLTSCIIPDESILKRLEVYIVVSSLRAHFSPSMYGAVVGLIANINMLRATSDSPISSMLNSLNTKLSGPRTPKVFSFSVVANIGSVGFLVDLENDQDNSCTLMLSLHELDIRLAQIDISECWISLKALRILSYSRKGEKDNHILCSSGNMYEAPPEHPCDTGVQHSYQSENCDHKIRYADGCFLLHFESHRIMDAISHKYTVFVSDVDFHCYPFIVGLLAGFIDKISKYDESRVVDDSFRSVVDGKNPLPRPDFDFQKFGFSNFCETGSSDWASIPLDRFPFVTIYNVGSLVNLENSLIHPIPEWRKVLNLRDRKIRSPKCNLKKGSKSLYVPSLKFPFGTDALPAPSCIDDSRLSVVDLNISNVRIHFHDSACIVGTITLPNSKCSVSIHEDVLDLLCSTEGLVLSSSWWNQSIHDFLWGPSLPNLSPILNVRVKKGNAGSFRSLFEISFGIQHVSCILPPEFLSMIIGYFSLPDWSSNATEQPPADNTGCMDSVNNSGITYKFEILDCTLLTPVEGDDFHFLMLDFQQLYGSFMHKSDPTTVLNDIPSECLVPSHKVADRNHCLNVFGCDLSLSLLLMKDDDAYDSSMFDKKTGKRCIALIAPVSTDVWVRIPSESESSCISSLASTCVMVRINSCQLFAEGDYAFVGYEALLGVISQLSLVEKESKCFTSSVLQFLQSKRNLMENSALLPEPSIVDFTETRLYVKSMSIKLCRPRGELKASELVAMADMQFKCSASFRNDKPICLDISFSSIALFSLINSVMLAECTASSISSVMEMNFKLSSEVENEIHVSVPSLDIWLHLFEWSEVIDLLIFYSRQLSKTSAVDASSELSRLVPTDLNENVTVRSTQNSPQYVSSANDFALENVKFDPVFLIVKSENLGLTVHIPVRVSDGELSIYSDAQVQKEGPVNDSCNVLEENHYNFVAVTLQSRCSELVSNGKTAKVKSKLEKISGTLEIYDKSVHTWPFFQLFHVNVDAEFQSNSTEHMHVKVEVQCDNLDVWLSHHVLYFGRYMRIEIPAAGSSKVAFGGIELEIQIRKVSLLLTDARWSSNGPLLEILIRNLQLLSIIVENKMEGSVAGDLQVNYNNIHKVLWEPFLEPWKFQLSTTRRLEKSALLNSAIMTDIHLKSTMQLNLNFTESFMEAVFRTIEMTKDAWDLMGLNDISESSRLLNSQIGDNNVFTGQYAPYILQNLTSLPLVFYVCQGPVSVDLDASALKEKKFVQPGSSIPIYIEESPEEQLFRCRPANSSDKLDKQLLGVAHRYIIIQLEGTSTPSAPVSMDLEGLSYFEVDFSKSSNKLEVGSMGDVLKINNNVEMNNRADANSGFIVPVVIDVSIQRHTKLVRLYSTVILLNATSVPLEVRFDIPFGVSPKILDPVYPGQEFPLPLHLAEAGRMRWRPLGNSCIWSEAYNISNILSRESRIGFLRSFVCYPSHPSNDPFRFCISVQDMCLTSIGRQKKVSSLHANSTINQSDENHGQVFPHLDMSEKRFIHLVTFGTPLVVKNYLPEAVSLTIESGGVTRTSLLSDVETSFFHVDSSHDLAISLHMSEYKQSFLKFPRAETFSTMAKSSGTKLSLSETIAFDSDLCYGPIYVTVDKVMDASSGAREICIFVPFLLYNYTGVSLVVSNAAAAMKGRACTVASCYDLDEQDLLLGRTNGLGLILSNQDFQTAPRNYYLTNSSLRSDIRSSRKNVRSQSRKFSSKPFYLSCSPTIYHGRTDKHDLDGPESSSNDMQNHSSSSSQSKFPDFEEYDYKKVNACMYSPSPNTSANEIMVRVSRCLSECVVENIPTCSWSSPFFLVPPTGSTSILVPQPFPSAAYIISVTSSAVAGPFSGRTRVTTFQPRYVISNACSKDVCFKQKGTDLIFHLGIGQHSHLHWTDTARELLVSVCFDEPGWQWSGCFLPEHLGDTQVKMCDYVSGAVSMIRVEVQNADVSIRDEKIVGNAHGNSGTNLILLSDDDTGFMPYRIDNFSKERLRIYQQRGETFETVIHSYTSCPYAWDEPCYPHRLTVEVVGERVIGSYTIDDVMEHSPAYLPATSEKPERTLLISVHAEGAMKVLSIIDSSYHILNDQKNSRVPRSKGKRKHDQKQETSVDYCEKISVSLPSIGISLINAYSEELLFACAKNTMIDLVQSLDQHKFSFQISYLQIDNQLRSTPYPVILSFDHEYVSNPVGQIHIKDDSESLIQIGSDSSCGPVFSLAAAKWRNNDISIMSFEYISLRVADFHLELEQEVILTLFDFFRSVSSRSQSKVLSHMDSTLRPLFFNLGFIRESAPYAAAHEFLKTKGEQIHQTNGPVFTEHCKSNPLPWSTGPIGAPWQQIYLLARRQRKIYVEVLDLAPIKLTLSFSSSPWMLRSGVLTSGESLIHRGLMALADVEGAQIHLKQLIIAHQLASWESIQEILIRHYTRQLLHEMYKVFGSAGVIGNPMGFARSVGIGLKDFLSVPARSVLKSPAGLITGMAQGTSSLLSNTIYAVSDAATQFSRAAHKGIVAFTFDDQAVAKMEKQDKGTSSNSKGVINEFFEGLTGLLQLPIKGAERHGLPGVLSGVALGVTGLVARPAASILEVTGKTAQSIRNRSKIHQMRSQRFRLRLPRPLSREFPLKPYSWEEAVGTSVLAEADDSLKLKDETLVMCKALKVHGKYVIVTEKLILVVSCSNLVNLGKPNFQGIPVDPEWVIEVEIGMDSVIHADTSEEVVHIVGSNSGTLLRQNQHQQKRDGTSGKWWINSPTLPLFQTNLEFTCIEEAADFLQVLLSTIEKGKEQGWGCVHLLHRRHLK